MRAELHPAFLRLPGEFVQGVGFKLISPAVGAQQVSAGRPRARDLTASVLRARGRETLPREGTPFRCWEVELRGRSSSALCHLPNCDHGALMRRRGQGIRVALWGVPEVGIWAGEASPAHVWAAAIGVSGTALEEGRVFDLLRPKG